MSSIKRIFLVLSCLGSFAQAHVEDSDPLKNIGNKNIITVKLKDLNLKPNTSEVELCYVRNLRGQDTEGRLVINIDEAQPFDRSLSFLSVDYSEIFVTKKESYSRYNFKTEGERGATVTGTFEVANFNYPNRAHLTVGDFKNAIQSCIKSAASRKYNLDIILKMVDAPPQAD